LLNIQRYSSGDGDYAMFEYREFDCLS
jgi:hypothetical protein